MRRRVLVTAILLTACGQLKETPTSPGGGGTPIDPNATFARVRAEVFTPSCTNIGCHDAIGRQGGLILTPANAYAVTVNRPSTQLPSLNLVTPGDVANSYLYRKITGAGITGDRMPPGSPPLSDEKIALVRDWIRRGAPND